MKSIQTYFLKDTLLKRRFNGLKKEMINGNSAQKYTNVREATKTLEDNILKRTREYITKRMYIMNERFMLLCIS